MIGKERAFLKLMSRAATLAVCAVFFLAPSTGAAQKVNSEFSAPARAGDEFGNANDILGLYVINPLDQILIVVYAGERQIGQYQEYVKSDGTVYMPFLERDVRLGDLRLLEAEGLLEKLARDYIKSPRVVLTVINSTQQVVSTYGMIVSQNVELRTPLKVLQLIARVGGLQDGAKSDSIRVISLDGTVKYFNYDEVNRDPSGDANFYMKPGDILFVPNDEDFSVIVLGNVQTPGKFPMKNGQQLLEALLAAGSWGNDADINNVRLLRVWSSNRVSVKEIDITKIFNDGDFSLNVPLQDGDMIFVPTKKGPVVLQTVQVFLSIFHTFLTSYAVYTAVGK
ncbi:MAG: SLBB domain-containing protein [Candidatus Latescibacteria bacterium]|nr:SLBB domain-containing protein [Candidatus Latescibacterota bacterium]